MAVRFTLGGATTTLFRRILSPGGGGGAYTLPRLPGPGGRPLYTEAALGLDQYLVTRQDTGVKFAGIADGFKERMRELLKVQEKAMIFTEDFKNIIHLATADPDDLTLVREMACRFNRQHQGLRFGMYIFGPVVMRTYHVLKQPQEALEALNDPQLSGFFEQLVSYQLAMDLLYKAARYAQVLQVFEELQETRIAGVRYPKNCLNLAIAACYKMSTVDSLDHLQGLLAKMQEYGIHANRRLLVMAASLALAVAHPHVALDLVTRSNAVTHISVRSVKVLSLCQLGRVGEALLALRAIIEIDLPASARSNKGMYILREAVSAVEAAVRAGGSLEQQVECGRIVKCLEEAKAISEKALEEVVCQPIDKFERRPGQERAMLAASFTHNASRTHTHTRAGHERAPMHSDAPTPPPRRRRGLRDME